jgi:sugar phosphate isomerase/epimerase
VRFAVFTVSLPEWSPAQAVTHLHDLGYDGIEWRVTDQPPFDDSAEPGFWWANRCTWPLASFVADAPKIRALGDDAVLAVPNIGAYTSCHDIDAVEIAMRGAARVGAPSIRVTMPVYDGRAPYVPLRDGARRDFDAVVRAAQRHGVRALIELHMQTIMPSASAAASFLADFDPVHVGVIHDAGNMVYEGFEAYRMGLEVLGPYLAHVHLKSARWFRDERRGWYGEFASLREGAVDVRALFDALAAVGYDGWVSFEDFSTAQPLLERTRDNLAYAREAFAASTASVATAGSAGE